MFFLLERRERKRAEARLEQAMARLAQATARTDEAKARADESKARADKAKSVRIEAAEATRNFLENLTDAQKDAIYSGPVIIGNILWIRIDGKYAVGPRDSTDWLVDALAPPRAPNRSPQCCCTP